MLIRKVFMCTYVILSYMPFLTGNEHVDTSKTVEFRSSESRKVFTQPEVSNDIERLLLRPVKFEKGNTTIFNQESVDFSLKPETEQNIEGITSILSAEKMKLSELENEYKKLEKELREDVDAKNSDLSVVKVGELSSMSFRNDTMTSIEKFAERATPSVLEKRDTTKKVISRIGSSTDQPRITKDKKPAADASEDLSHRLSKMVGNGRLLDLAECFYKLGEYNNALQTYKLITSSDVSSDQYTWVQYQMANCYRNMREFDLAISEYQRFIDQYSSDDLIVPAKWYIDDVSWWKSWYEKNALTHSR